MNTCVNVSGAKPVSSSRSVEEYTYGFDVICLLCHNKISKGDLYKKEYRRGYGPFMTAVYQCAQHQHKDSEG